MKSNKKEKNKKRRVFKARRFLVQLSTMDRAFTMSSAVFIVN